jgi:hypothetical protein
VNSQLPTLFTLEPQKKKKMPKPSELVTYRFTKVKGRKNLEFRLSLLDKDGVEVLPGGGREELRSAFVRHPGILVYLPYNNAFTQAVMAYVDCSPMSFHDAEALGGKIEQALEHVKKFPVISGTPEEMKRLIAEGKITKEMLEAPLKRG